MKGRVVYDEAKLRAMWASNVTIQEIAVALGVSTNFVSTLRVRHGLPRRRSAYTLPVQRDPTPAEIETRKREIRERKIAEMRGTS